MEKFYAECVRFPARCRIEVIATRFRGWRLAWNLAIWKPEGQARSAEKTSKKSAG
jgi:hypothetical protein